MMNSYIKFVVLCISPCWPRSIRCNWILAVVLQDIGESGDVASALKMLDAASIKSAASELVRAGAGLHDALAAEATGAREARLRALAGTVGTEEVRGWVGGGGNQDERTWIFDTDDLSCVWEFMWWSMEVGG